MPHISLVTPVRFLLLGLVSSLFYAEESRDVTDLSEIVQAIHNTSPFTASFWDPSGARKVSLARTNIQNFHALFTGYMASGSSDVDFTGRIIDLNEKSPGATILAFGERGFSFFVLRRIPAKERIATTVTLGYDFRLAEGLKSAEIIDRTSQRLAEVSLLPGKMGRSVAGVVADGVVLAPDRIGGVKFTFAHHFSAVDWVEVPFVKLQADTAADGRYRQPVGMAGELQATVDAKREPGVLMFTLTFTPAPGQEGKEHAIVTTTVRNKAREVVGSSGEYGAVSAAPQGILSIKQENVAKADKVFVAVGRNLVHGASLIIPAHVRE